MSELDNTSPASLAGDNRSRSRRWPRWAVIAVAVVLAIGVLVALLWPGTAWWVEHVDGVKLHGDGALTGKDRLEVLDKARGRITAVATGILAAFAIYYTAANARSARETARAAQESVQAALRAADHTEEAQRRTHELTERGQLTDRFTAAVAQLGDTNPAIQLGGVHALAGIADDAPRTLRQTCIDVLCAYLRLPYPPDPGPLADERQANLTERDAHEQQRIAYRGLREVRHTIIRLIGNHLRLSTEDPRSWQGYDFDFSDVVFDGGDLSGAHFSGGTTTFNRATFTQNFNFRNTTFSGARVNFVGATFSGNHASFERATFSGSEVDFMGAVFSGDQLSFRLASFSAGRVDFRLASFSSGQVSFERATFSGGEVDFGVVTFSGGQVIFKVATFSGGRVSFEGANFCGSQVNFGVATFSEDQVTFESASFSSGEVIFRLASFSGGKVDFGGAKFSGGEVDFVPPRAWERPPVGIPVDAEGRPPEGVLLPGLN